MRKDFGSKPILYPMPVLIITTYDKDGTPNAMNAAWGGISEANEISICISEDHKTTKNLLSNGDFTVSVATADYVAECDYLGLASGNNVKDKLSACGLHAEKSSHINAPLVTELPLALECRLKSYDPETCRLVGEIINVCADESVLTNGTVDVSKLRPITYDTCTHSYRVVGERVGSAFSDGKKFIR